MEKERIYNIAMSVLMLVAIVVGAFVLAEQDREELLRQKSECYSLYGKENITLEVLDSGYYHAYINDTLVYAHGRQIAEH